MPALARKESEPVALVFEEGFAVDDQRRHAAQLLFAQFDGKGVLFANCRIAETPWTIELADDEAAIFEPELVDAVFVAVECQHAAAWLLADGLEGVEQRIWIQALVGGGAVVHWFGWTANGGLPLLSGGV